MWYIHENSLTYYFKTYNYASWRTRWIILSMFLKMLEKIFGKALKIAVKKSIINFPQFYVGNDRISIFEAALSLHIHSFQFFLIWINMKGWTTTTRNGVTRKRDTKRLKHPGNLFRKNLQLSQFRWTSTKVIPIVKT